MHCVVLGVKNYWGRRRQHLLCCLLQGHLDEVRPVFSFGSLGKMQSHTWESPKHQNQDMTNIWNSDHMKLFILMLNLCFLSVFLLASLFCPFLSFPSFSLLISFAQDFSNDDTRLEYNVDADNGIAMEGYLFKRASNAFKTWNRYQRLSQ